MNTEYGSVRTYRGWTPSRPLVSETSIVEPLFRHAEATPAAPFLSEVGANCGETVTYRAAAFEVRQIAAHLEQIAGASPGVRIGVLPKNDVTSVLLILGVLATGATAVLMNPNDPAARVNEQLAKVGCQAAVLFGYSGPAPSAAQLLDGNRIRGARAGSATFDISRDRHASALILFTTGTTASSKAVVQTHYNVLVNSTALGNHHGLGRRSRLLGVLPVYFANGFEFTVVAPMIAGGHALLGQSFDPLRYLDLLEEHQPDIASLVPSMLDTMVQARRRPDLSSLRYFASAAAPLRQSTAIRTLEKLRRRVVQGYGLSETTNFSTIMPIGLSEAGYRRWTLETDIPAVGSELFGNQVAILDGENRGLPDGEVGEICMRGHNVMAGYHSNQQATDEAFRGGWFHSGDLGVFRTDPETALRILTITGRIKNMVKVGGYAVSLDEIDRLILSVDGVVDAASFAMPDPNLGETISVLIVPLDGGGATEETIRHVISRHLARGLQPRSISFVEQIPRSPNGKVVRSTSPMG